MQVTQDLLEDTSLTSMHAVHSRYIHRHERPLLYIESDLTSVPLRKYTFYGPLEVFGAHAWLYGMSYSLLRACAQAKIL